MSSSLSRLVALSVMRLELRLARLAMGETAAEVLAVFATYAGSRGEVRIESEQSVGMGGNNDGGAGDGASNCGVAAEAEVVVEGGVGATRSL